jgi:TRAP-type uncharacterized transport system fused permease subunit
MASIPTVLYYLSCLLLIEADSRRMQTQAADVQTLPLRDLTLKYGYHFTSLFAVLMALGMTPFLAVFWSIAISFLSLEMRLTSLIAFLPAPRPPNLPAFPKTRFLVTLQTPLPIRAHSRMKMWRDFLEGASPLDLPHFHMSVVGEFERGWLPLAPPFSQTVKQKWPS